MADVDATYPPKASGRVPNDPFEKYDQELDGPAYYGYTITPNQSLLPKSVRALYIGTSGNLFVQMAGGNTTNQPANAFFMNVVGGTILPIRVDGVYSYNTERHASDLGAITATGGNSSQNTTAEYIVGLY